MAFYAEMRRRKWYCVNRFNAILWYRKKLYDDWYSSLTEEQRAEYLESRKRAQEESSRRAKESLMQLMSLMSLMSNTRYRPSEKLMTLYDEDGYPKH